MKIKAAVMGVLFAGILLIRPATGLEIKTGTDAWPPFRIVKNGKITGFDIDLINEIARRLNTGVEITRCP